MAGNIPLETMDETIDDDTKDPGQLLQRGPSAAEPEGSVTEITDGAMDCDLVAPAVSTSTPVNWDQMNRRQRKNWRLRHIHTK